LTRLATVISSRQGLLHGIGYYYSSRDSSKVPLFIFGLFNDDVSSSDYTVGHGTILFKSALFANILTRWQVHKQLDLCCCVLPTVSGWACTHMFTAVFCERQTLLLLHILSEILGSHGGEYENGSRCRVVL